ncbi:MAG: glycine--tRNA ligase subunit beta [Paracoccaceae bacterium]
MPDLLIELFSEEIPARMQKRASEDLQKLVTDGLVEAGLTYTSAGAFATPRRLCLTLEGLTAQSPDTREERKGPRADAPEQALAGFLRSTGLTRDQLEVRASKKGDVFFALIERAGRPASDIVSEVLESIIRKFPWPKSMRWGQGALKWVRPLQSILCVLSDENGTQIVPLDIDGIKAGDTTRGHRFMAPGAFKVTGFDDYAAKLKTAKVLLDPAARADHIWADATTLAFAQGLEVVEDKGLLAEVAGLVEWPVVLLGDIGADYLELPPEVLQTSMREHQKFFSVKNAKTGRIEKFITVANIETADNGVAILAGNQKVLAARLADAKFFWENDLRTPLADMATKLETVTFHNKLGSQADRVLRIAALAREIAPLVGADADEAEAAAKLAKADLMSEMVSEFPELQGVMGRYYAKSAGLSDAVAAAAQEHYAPLGPSDDVPTAPVSVAVALADKIDILTGFWAIDEKPTGSKDPFALRRATLGVIRLVLENQIQGPAPKIGGDLLSFFHDRLKVYLRDQGIRHDVIDACIAMPGNDDLTLLVKRATALSDFLKTDDGENLLQGFKRANNILVQAEDKDGVEYSYGAEEKFLQEPAEKALFKALNSQGGAISTAIEAEDFASAMASMADLRTPIDAFFEALQVNDDSAVIRRNRLNILSQIRKICLSAADLNRIEG